MVGSGDVPGADLSAHSRAVVWRSPKLLIGLLILLPAWQGLVFIKQLPMGNWLIMAVMVLVWGRISVPIFRARPLAGASWPCKSAQAKAGKVCMEAWPCAW